MDIYKKSLIQLADLLNKKEVSAFELTNYFLKRISKFDSKLNSLISMNEENALKKAKEADELISKKHGLINRNSNCP